MYADNKHDWYEQKTNHIHHINNNQYTVIVIGTTGVGKSSLIKLFCGPSVITSNGTNSCTQVSKIFSDILDNNRKWLDTKGTDDSKMQSSDDIILKESFKALYHNNANLCKIIWCVGGDIKRAKNSFGIQARYIMNFGLPNNTTNVWRSCLIIKKCGKKQPKMSSMAGIIDAAKQFGNNGILTEQNLIGYKCIDDNWSLDEENLENYIDFKDDSSLSDDKLQKKGFLTSEQIMELVNEKLNALPTFKLKFFNKKCDKCGAEGDPRYMDVMCHTVKKQHHPTQEIKKFHKGTFTKCFHFGNLLSNESVTEERRYHSGVYQKKRTNVRDFFTGFSLMSLELSDVWCEWTCCDNPSRDASGCKNEIITKSNGYKYSCCSTSKDSIGCSVRYTCCPSIYEDSAGKEICELCKRNWGEGPGCAFAKS